MNDSPSGTMEQQFLKAYELHADGVYRYCLTKLSDEGAALDAVQDTFMRYWNMMRSGSVVRHDRALLFTIARRLVIDEYRAKSKRAVSLEKLSEDGFDPKGDDAADVEADADTARAISMIEHLPHEYRDALELRYVEGFEPKEIAKILGESANAITVRIHRGVAKLRAQFNPKTKHE